MANYSPGERNLNGRGGEYRECGVGGDFKKVGALSGDPEVKTELWSVEGRAIPGTGGCKRTPQPSLLLWTFFPSSLFSLGSSGCCWHSSCPAELSCSLLRVPRCWESELGRAWDLSPWELQIKHRWHEHRQSRGALAGGNCSGKET